MRLRSSIGVGSSSARTPPSCKKRGRDSLAPGAVPPITALPDDVLVLIFNEIYQPKDLIQALVSRDCPGHRINTILKQHPMRRIWLLTNQFGLRLSDFNEHDASRLLSMAPGALGVALCFVDGTISLGRGPSPGSMAEPPRDEDRYDEIGHDEDLSGEIQLIHTSRGYEESPDIDLLTTFDGAPWRRRGATGLVYSPERLCEEIREHGNWIYPWVGDRRLRYDLFKHTAKPQRIVFFSGHGAPAEYCVNDAPEDPCTTVTSGFPGLYWGWETGDDDDGGAVVCARPAAGAPCDAPLWGLYSSKLFSTRREVWLAAKREEEGKNSELP